MSRGSARARRQQRRRGRRRPINFKRVLFGAGIGGAIAVAGLIAYSVFFLVTGGVSREGSIESAGGQVEVSNVPSSFRIVYRVEEFAGGDYQISTEESRVKRPFDGMTEKREGLPPGKKLLSTQTSTFGKVTFPASGNTPIILVTAPATAVGDLRPDAVLEEGVKEGLLDRREVRRIAGRRCQVYRSGGPVTAGQLLSIKEATDESTDFCVDESGFLLEEVWYGTQRSLRVLERPRAIRRKVAVEIEEEPVLSDELFKIGEQTIPFETAGGRLTPLKPDSRSPGRFWILEADTTRDFEHFGKFLVVPPSLDVMGMSGVPGTEGQGNRIVSVSDVYIKEGRDLVVLDQGTTQQGRSPFGPPLRQGGVDLGAELGRGRVIQDFRMNEVRVSLEGGTFVRLYGTFPTDFLIEVLKTAKPIEGSDFQFLE